MFLEINREGDREWEEKSIEIEKRPSGIIYIFACLGCYWTLIGSQLPTFRDNISVSSSLFQQSMETAGPLKIGPRSCTETSATD